MTPLFRVARVTLSSSGDTKRVDFVSLGDPSSPPITLTYSSEYPIRVNDTTPTPISAATHHNTIVPSPDVATTTPRPFIQPHVPTESDVKEFLRQLFPDHHLHIMTILLAAGGKTPTDWLTTTTDHYHTLRKNDEFLAGVDRLTPFGTLLSPTLTDSKVPVIEQTEWKCIKLLFEISKRWSLELRRHAAAASSRRGTAMTPRMVEYLLVQWWKELQLRPLLLLWIPYPCVQNLLTPSSSFIPPRTLSVAPTECPCQRLDPLDRIWCMSCETPTNRLQLGVYEAVIKNPFAFPTISLDLATILYQMTRPSSRGTSPHLDDDLWCGTLLRKLTHAPGRSSTVDTCMKIPSSEVNGDERYERLAPRLKCIYDIVAFDRGDGDEWCIYLKERYDCERACATMVANAITTWQHERAIVTALVTPTPSEEIDAIPKSETWISQVIRGWRKFEQQLRTTPMMMRCSAVDPQQEEAIATIAALHLRAYTKKSTTDAHTWKIAILTGGPGTGKSQTLLHVLRLIAEGNRAASFGGVLPQCMAVTGMATSMLRTIFSRSGGCPLIASPCTIFRWCHAKKNAAPLVPFQHLIIDEMSMVSHEQLALLVHTLSQTTVPGGTIMITMVGDPLQLSPITYGAVFDTILALHRRRDVILPVFELHTTHRTTCEDDDGSSSAEVTHRSIRLGRTPSSSLGCSPYCTVSEIPAFDADTLTVQIRRHLDVWVTTASPTHSPILNRIPEVGVLTGINEHVRMLNTILRIYWHEKLQTPGFPTQDVVATLPTTRFFIGDRVMMSKNLYLPSSPDLILANGFRGTVVKVDSVGVSVLFDGGGGEVFVFLFQRQHPPSHHHPPHGKTTGRLECSMLNLAFAFTVDKSQGSEFRFVVCAFPETRNVEFYNRSRIYTAITRAKEQVVIFVPRIASLEAMIATSQPKRIGNLSSMILARAPLSSEHRQIGDEFLS